MSQWRTRGYVQDSDEEEDLDFIDPYSTVPPEANTDVGVVKPEGSTAFGSDPLPETHSQHADRLGSHDELDFEDTGSSSRPAANSHLDVPRPKPTTFETSPPHPNNGSSQDVHKGERYLETTDSQILPCREASPPLGIASSEIPVDNGMGTQSRHDTYLKNKLATQLFSDQDPPTTSDVNAWAPSSRPATPRPQDEEVDELQRDWPSMQNVGSSAFSSPLSDARSDISHVELPSSPPVVSAYRQIPLETTEGNGEIERRAMVQVVIPRKEPQMSNIAGANQLSEAEGTRTGRALRKRNLIQLHPYRLEGEVYRKAFKESGLKPVNVRVPRPRHHEETQNSESQDREFLADDTQLSSVHHSSQLDTASSPPRVGSPASSPEDAARAVGTNSAQIDLSDDDELPDLSVLLLRKHQNPAQRGHKRRKTIPKFSKKGSLNRTSSLGQLLRQDAAPIAGSWDVFDVPPSPPPSRTPPLPPRSLAQNRPFRTLPDLTPLGPPTPTTSSSRKPVTKTVVQSDSDEDTLHKNTWRRPQHEPSTSITIVSSDSSSSELEDNREVELRRMQKRIKGVLPASWLRLDQQAQAKRKLVTQPTHHRRKTSGAPTIRTATAEPNVLSSHSTPITSREHDHSTDGSDCFEEEMPSTEALPPRRNRHEGLDRVLDDYVVSEGIFEVREHDWIDPMLPSGSRSHSHAKSKRKRQLKLTESMSGVPKRLRLDSHDAPKSAANTHPQSARPRKSGTRIGERPKKAARPTVPRLSILDAPTLNATEPARVPQFIRLAARQVRQQPNKGRHSPGKKHIRLQTEADTEDAHALLHEWRAGTIFPSTRFDQDIPTASARHPLVDRVDNQQLHQQQLPLPEQMAADNGRQTREDSTNEKSVRPRIDRPKVRQIKLKPLSMARSAMAPKPLSRVQKPKVHIAQRPANQKSKLKQPEYRTAQLEDLEDEYDAHHRAAAFYKKLSRMERLFADRLRNSEAHNPQVTKFLQDEDAVAPLPAAPVQSTDVVPSIEITPPAVNTTKRTRKTKVKRVDVEAREYRQPSDPPPINVNDIPTLPEPELVKTPFLEGLGPFGTRYTTDFDVFSLSVGTFFHESTLLGSGEFQRALRLTDRDLDGPAGLCIFSHDGTTFRWSAWTEEVASEMSSLMSSNIARLDNSLRNDQIDRSGGSTLPAQGDVLCLVRTIMRYLSWNLHFLDPVDRRSFVIKMQNLLETVSISIVPTMESSPENPFQGSNPQETKTRARLLLSVLTYQVLQVARHPHVDDSLTQGIGYLLKTLVKPLLRSILRNGMSQLRLYLEDNRRHTIREHGIREDKLAVECLVMTSHILDAVNLPHTSFWEMVKEELTPSMSSLCHVKSFERLWYDVFTLLPYLEFDSIGILAVGRRFQADQGEWSLVVPLLSQLFASYLETSKKSGSSLNVYLRSCLMRCYGLIQSWGWTKCESLLTTIFDFFSRRSFTHLQNEESRGSPRFLQMLEQHPSLAIQPDDHTFHIFLKILAVGFKSLRHQYKEKQIQNISWRLVPNHSRTYHKEEALRQEDLDGLRNQHDLLCTLYWASPPGFRPRLTLLRDLVDQTCSHREVCRLSVRACSNLARYQISTDEGMAALEPFAEWFNKIITQNIAQHRLARSEAESHYEAARFQGHDHISAEHLQLTIKNNQAQIIATLADAVAGMKAAIGVAHDVESATLFLQKSAIPDVFKLFDAKNPQAGALIGEVLGVFQDYLKLLERKEPRMESQQTSEESQDYGEWPEFEDDGPVVLRNPATPSVSIDFLHDSVWQLVSSCFGADMTPDDKLLTNTVDTWTLTADRLVRKGQKEWSNYLDPYSANSWRQLQDTEQTRKYGAYFMSAVMDRDPGSYAEHRDDFFTAWILSLVERESMLKFQHRFTTSLLNRDSDHPLLRNLPFLKDDRSGCVNISLSEFRERRLNLLSTLLANMRDAYDEAMRSGYTDLPGLRREYTSLLKPLMGAMRKNYLELQQDSHVKSAYVQFVQTVVEFLQQHTSDIYAVDKFFTDSTAFPLPATDPTYVVGRLKGYAPKLSEQKTLKQLAIFINTVSERAAVDDQQAYLVSQLRAATLGSFEGGDASRPTLRQVLLQAIFPAYIELAFKATAGWIVAKPILQATCPMLQELSMQYSATDPRSVAVAEGILTTTLDALLGATELLITHSGLLDQPHVLHLLSWILRAAAASVPAASYMHRRTGCAGAAIQRIASFRAFSLFVASTLIGGDDIFSPYADWDSGSGSGSTSSNQTTGAEPAHLADIRLFCTRELSRALATNWVHQADAQYVLVRGNIRREVPIADVGSPAAEKAGVLRAVEALHGALQGSRMTVLVGMEEEEEAVRRRRREKGRGWPGALLVI